MKPILKWQYDQLIKNLILLQDHWSDPSCPCDSDGEACVRKHLLAIEGYAEETIAIEGSEGKKADLRKLAAEAKDIRELEERALCGKVVTFPLELDEWARNWRKSFESYSLACQMIANPDGKLDRCVAAVEAKIKKGELPEGSNPWAICQSTIKGGEL